MPIIGGVIILLQLSVIYHAMKTGRSYYWIFIIMGFPILGCVVYFIIEVLPGSRSERGLKKIGNDIVKAINPDRELKRRAEELAICGSVENKLKLAAECVERGMFDEAIRIYRGAREGQYQNAPDLLLGLARAYYFNNQPTEARATLGELRSHHADYYRQEVAILSARAADACGDRAAALAELESLLSHSVGLEARYRYAEILWRNGEPARARAELKRVLEHAEKFRVSPAEKQWAKLSRQTLASLG